MFRVLYTLTVILLLGASAIAAMDIDSRRMRITGNPIAIFAM